jgi:hypothetical protein
MGVPLDGARPLRYLEEVLLPLPFRILAICVVSRAF